MEEDETETEEPQMRIRKITESILISVMYTLEEFAKRWKGIIKISYDDTQPIRDYIIRVIVNEMDFYNRFITHEFGDLLGDVNYMLIRSYSKDKSKIEIVVIHSNGEEIFCEDDLEYD